MTEAEYLTSDDLTSIGWFVAGEGSKRKVALFTCACCRKLWDELADVEILKCLHAAERYADGMIPTRTASRWYERAKRCRNSLTEDSCPPSRILAYEAVVKAVVSPELGYVHQDILQGILAQIGLLPGSEEWISEADGVSRRLIQLIRDIFGNPFLPITLTPPHQTPTVVSLARAAYDERHLPSGELDPLRLAVLADALEEAEATDELVAHLRGSGPHVRGCFVVDLCLGLC